jgi:manganese efflux pump family protein
VCHNLDMDFSSIFIIAISLSADCFAVALSSSIAHKHFSFIRLLRLPLLFGVFQTFMAVMGWLAGRSVVEFISSYDHWLAFGLLLFIGGRMIWHSFHEHDEGGSKKNLESWLILITLSIATSIDSLAVGLSFAFLEVNIALAAATIGVTAFIVTLIGILIGKRLGRLAGERAETIGGVILIIIGLRILLEHLL